MATNMATRDITSTSIEVRAWYQGSTAAERCDINIIHPDGYRDVFASFDYGSGDGLTQYNWTTEWATAYDLEPNTQYTFFAAFMEYVPDRGVWRRIERTDNFYFTTDGDETPATPDPWVDEVGTDYVYIAWNSDPLAWRFLVEIESVSDDSYYEMPTVDGTWVLFSNMTPGIQYRYRAAALGYGDTDSNFSTWQYFYTAAPPKSVIPSPHLYSQREGSLYIDYYVSSGAYYDIELVRSWDSYTIAKSTYDSRYDFVGLNHGTQYHFYARAKEEGKEWSEWSSKIILFTLPLTPEISLNKSTSTTVTINIDVASGNVTGYRIRTLSSTGSLLKTNTISTTSKSITYEITGLTAGTTYMFEVESFHNYSGSNMYSYYYSNRLTVKVGHARPEDWAWEYPIYSGGSFYSQSGKTAYLMEATHWNDFTARINAFRQYKGVATYAFTQATTLTSETGLISCINQAINAINDMLVTGKMSNISSGDDVAASIFINLKNKLNSII